MLPDDRQLVFGWMDWRGRKRISEQICPLIKFLWFPRIEFDYQRPGPRRHDMPDHPEYKSWFMWGWWGITVFYYDRTGHEYLGDKNILVFFSKESSKK